jgi:hypothetical protein
MQCTRIRVLQLLHLQEYKFEYMNAMACNGGLINTVLQKVNVYITNR